MLCISLNDCPTLATCCILSLLTAVFTYHSHTQAKVAAKEREASENEHQLRQEVRHTHELLSKSSRELEQLRAELSHQAAASSEKQAHLISQEKDKILRVSKCLFL